MSNQVVEVGENAGSDDSKPAFCKLQRSKSIPQRDTNSLFHIEQVNADFGSLLMTMDQPACSPIEPTAPKPVSGYFGPVCFLLGLNRSCCNQVFVATLVVSQVLLKMVVAPKKWIS